VTGRTVNGRMSVPDDLPELDDDDLAVLGEALEAWEHKDAASEIFGDMLEAFAGGHRTVASLHESRAKEKADALRERTIRKERSVLLRAKLIAIRKRRRRVN
jgi:hypothetical protein